MCLIVYVPEGKSIPRETFKYAGTQNDDGIGVMSVQGIRKFHGRKKLKRARRYSEWLSGKGVPHGVHFRWRTHGDYSVDNIHPFSVPGTHAWLMHNGVIRQTERLATAEKSDTRLYVDSLKAPASVDPAVPSEFWGGVEDELGWANRALVMYQDTGVFYLLNEKGGEWIDGCWYSNTYSLPKGFYKDDWSAYTPVRYSDTRTGYASNETTYGGYCSRCWLPMRATGTSCTCDMPDGKADDLLDDIFLAALELAHDDDEHASALIDAALDATKGDERKALEILQDELAARDEAETGDDVPADHGAPIDATRDPITGVWVGRDGVRYASRGEMERCDAFLPLDGENTHDWDN